MSNSSASEQLRRSEVEDYQVHLRNLVHSPLQVIANSSRLLLLGEFGNLSEEQSEIVKGILNNAELAMAEVDSHLESQGIMFSSSPQETD
jgi:hypothetical protein